jgi:hypothetical protein
MLCALDIFYPHLLPNHQASSTAMIFLIVLIVISLILMLILNPGVGRPVPPILRNRLRFIPFEIVV